MTAPSGAAPGSGGASPLGEDRRATVAGALLVVAAVVIGLILLAKGFSDDGGFLSTSKKSSNASHTTTTLPGHATSTTEAVDPATVKIYVANASGKAGAATKVSTVLAGKQYPAPAVGNAATAATTMVYYLPGSAPRPSWWPPASTCRRPRSPPCPARRRWRRSDRPPCWWSSAPTVR